MSGRRQVEDEPLRAVLEAQGSYSDVRPLDAEKHDTNLLSGGAVDAFEVTGNGNVAITTGAGGERVIGVTAGRLYPVRVTRMKSTGTTATGILGYVL